MDEQPTTQLPTAANQVKLVVRSIGRILGAVLFFVAGFATAMALVFYLSKKETDRAALNMMLNEYTEQAEGHHRGLQVEKPVIYLYPTQTTAVTVLLKFAGKITTDIPQYDKRLAGWQVTAEPSGDLTTADGHHYPYLFWEGEPNNINIYSDPTGGFVVTPKEAETFLRTTLPQLGLQPKEYEEFIEFWLPRLQQNQYNLVHFAGAEYLDQAKLTVEPTPDSVIRVFMVMQPLNEPVAIKPQQFITPQRTGFTVVEWGGTMLPKE
jgi:hypothetical protein